MTPITIAFWKPYDVLSKFTDPDGRATLADYIDLSAGTGNAGPNTGNAGPSTGNAGPSTGRDVATPKDLYGAGRLDRDSEGLLILSQDRALRAVLTEPRHAIARTYWVNVEGVPTPEAIEALCRGVMIKGERTAPARARLLDGAPDLPERSVPIRVRKTVPDRWIELELSQGKNRQVRRMTAAVGHPTLRLVRVKIGPIGLEGLEPGQWRPLNASETAQLYRASRSGSPSESRPRRPRRPPRRGASR